jgi:hypothetical protein
MAKKIDFSEIVDIQSLKALVDTLTDIEEKLKNILTASSKTVTGKATSYTEIKKQVEAIDAATQAVEGLTIVEKQAAEAKVKLAAATREQNAILKNETLAAASAEGSYNKLAAQYNLNKIALNKMSAEQRKATEEGRKLEAETAAIYTEMNNLQKATGKYVLQVGNYEKAAEIATMSLGEMKREMMALRNTSFTGKSEQEVKALKIRIGELTDKMGDMKQEMKMLGTENAAVVVSGMKLIAASVEGVVGTLSVFGVEAEVVQKLEKKMVMLIAVTQSLAEIEDAVSSGKLRAIGIRLQSMAVDLKDTVVKWSSVVAANAQTKAEAARATMVGKGSLITKAAAAAQWLWNAALAANPIGLIIAGVVALGAAIGALVIAYRNSSEASNQAAMEARLYGEATDKAVESSAKERVEMSVLFSALKKTTEGTKERSRAIDEVNKQYGKYLPQLLTEKSTLNEIAVAQNLVSNAILKKARVMAFEERLTELYKEQYKTIRELANDKADIFQAEDFIKPKAVQIAEGEVEIEKMKREMISLMRLLSKDYEFETEVIDKNTKAVKNNIEAKAKLVEVEKRNQQAVAAQAATNNERVNQEAKQEADDKKELDKKDREEAKQAFDTQMALLEHYLNTRQEKRQRALDYEIEQSKRQQDYFKQLAAQGSEDAQKNLAFEEQKQAQLQAQKEKELRRAKQVELGLSVLKAYSSNVEKYGADAALQKTIKDTILLTQLVKSLPAFYEGTEDTGGRGQLDANGGKLAILHPHERVMTAEQNAAVTGLSNWDLVNAGQLYKAAESGNWMTGDKVIEKFDRIEKQLEALNAKPTYLGSDYDKLSHEITHIIDNNSSLTRNHKRLSRLD